MNSLVSLTERAIRFVARPRRVTWLLGLGLLLAVVGAKYLVIDRFGSDIPNWDQWDAEAENLLLPYFQHRLGFLDLFAPHNEHRIAPTKALNLAVVLLNGQWDGRLQCSINALLHAATAVAVFLYGRRLFPDRRIVSWLALVLVLFGVPLAWPNIIGGFHSQQYFLVGFSLAAIGLLVETRAFSPRWLAGAACVAGAIVSMGAGFFASVAIVCALALAHGPSSLLRRHLATAVLCALAIAAGWMLHVVVYYHEPLKAHSLADFVTTIWFYLQWPLREVAWFALLSFLPWALLAWRVWRQRDRIDAREIAVVGAGAWVLLQIAATAYARGAGGGWPAERYLDSLTIGTLANGASVLILWRTTPAARWLAAAKTALFAVWGVSAAWGVVSVARGSIGHALPAEKHYFVNAERSTRAYLATGDESFLDDPNIPYPSKVVLIERLAHPEIRAILPASIRAPLRLEGTAAPPGSFITPPADYKFAQPWRTWRSGAPAEPPGTGSWQSGLLPRSAFRFWRIEVTGHPEMPDVSLQIVARDSGRILEKIVPHRAAHDSWRPAFVRAPTADATLVARDASTDRWLGFSEPVEMATLSVFAVWAVKQGITLLVVGLVLVLAGSVLAWFRPDRGPR